MNLWQTLRRIDIACRAHLNWEQISELGMQTCYAERHIRLFGLVKVRHKAFLGHDKEITPVEIGDALSVLPCCWDFEQYEDCKHYDAESEDALAVLG